MKKLSFALLALVCISTLICCGGDDPAKKSNELEASFLDEPISLDDDAGYYNTFGTTYYGPPVDGTPVDTHFYSGYMIADGALLDGCSPDYASYYIGVELYTAGDAFALGEYEVLSERSANLTGINFATASVVVYQGESSTSFWWNTDGTVTIMKKGDSYILEWELTGPYNEGTATITGYFQGEFALSESICFG